MFEKTVYLQENSKYSKYFDFFINYRNHEMNLLVLFYLKLFFQEVTMFLFKARFRQVL